MMTAATAAAAGASSVRVGLVDDHHIVREGLRLVLESLPGVLVVGEASCPSEAHQLLEASEPDVLLLDVSLGSEDALPLIPLLLAHRPALRILMLTMHRDPETVRQALRRGASGYLVKGAFASELPGAIRAVVRGERYLHSSITESIVADSMRWLGAGSEITPREREILGLFAGGETAVQIGRQLGISTNTVRRHLANIASKLEVRGRAALTRYAAEHGVLRSSPAR